MGGGHPLRVSSKLYPRVRCLLNDPCSPLFFVGTIYNTVHSNIDSRESSYQFLIGMIYSCILIITYDINFIVEYMCLASYKIAFSFPHGNCNAGSRQIAGFSIYYVYTIYIHKVYIQACIILLKVKCM